VDEFAVIEWVIGVTIFERNDEDLREANILLIGKGNGLFFSLGLLLIPFLIDLSLEIYPI
jgi:hypothetical protein